jgi:hypothetical protein
MVTATSEAYCPPIKIPSPNPIGDMVNWLKAIQYYSKNSSAENRRSLIWLIDQIPPAARERPEIFELCKIINKKKYDDTLSSRVSDALQAILGNNPISKIEKR